MQDPGYDPIKILQDPIKMPVGIIDLFQYPVI